jgi:hypothetical protein
MMHIGPARLMGALRLRATTRFPIQPLVWLSTIHPVFYPAVEEHEKLKDVGADLCVGPYDHPAWTFAAIDVR